MMRKKRFTLFLAVVLAMVLTVGLTACRGGEDTPSEATSQEETGQPEQSQPQEESEQQGQPEQDGASRAAVVYFSATGTTAEVAKLIAEETGADIFEIVPEEAYTPEDLNYSDDDCRANREMNDDGARPAISSDLSAVSEYDVVYLGHPIWWGTAPRIIQTFLESCDLSKATVYTFCTSGGSGIEQSLEDLRGLYSDVTIAGGKRFTNASEADVKGWIDSLE